jgi:hypothetical protein
MGNIIQSPIQNKPIETSKFEESNISLVNEEIFIKILNVSNDLLIEYNNDFLKEDFCNKLALIYEKKLSKFNIKILKSLYNNINSNEIDNTLLATIQYYPKDDDKFLVDIFKDSLNENFWKKNVELIPGIISSNSEIESYIKYTPNYISLKHVNYLLNTLNNNKEEIITELNTEKNIKVGGKYNINSFQKKNNIKFISNKKISKENFSNSNGIEENSLNNKKYKSLNGNPLEGNSSNSSNRNGLEANSSNRNGLKTNSSNKNSLEKNSSNRNRLEANSSNKNGLEANSSNKNGLKTNSSNKNRLEANSSNKNRLEANSSNKNSLEINSSNKNRLEANSSNKNHLEANSSNKNSLEEKLPNKEISLEVINKITNNSIVKNSIKINKEDKKLNKEIFDDKFVNKLIKYSVPNYYKEPSNFCNSQEKCELTKKQLCQSISENFIVRNNIIAAILTTIPYKNESGEYEGGICYQKFMNLEKCHVCVPYDYNELKDKDIKDVLTKILEKASYLNKNQCRENNGYFLALSGDEKKILSKKIIKSNKDEIEKHPKVKYNLFFKEFTDKLKKNYFDNLTLLLNILEKMKNIAIINNSTLNILSEETKKIIDNMYNLCHYYYIYAIISLINSDITEEIIKEDKLESIISHALDK